ncbi:hypothetical protein LXL04_015508 [Taraxacum kok-saghyz]
MELELSLSPPNQSRHPIMRKSCHGGGNSVTRCPLVSWDQEEEGEPNKSFYNGDYQQDLEGDGEGLVGWPPLHSWRRRLIEGVGYNIRDDEQEEEEEGDNINVMNNNYNESLFVKVKMDGVGIARKIDLNAFHSYQMLTTTLLHMFDKCNGFFSLSARHRHNEGCLSEMIANGWGAVCQPSLRLSGPLSEGHSMLKLIKMGQVTSSSTKTKMEIGILHDTFHGKYSLVQFTVYEWRGTNGHVL